MNSIEATAETAFSKYKLPPDIQTVAYMLYYMLVYVIKHNAGERYQDGLLSDFIDVMKALTVLANDMQQLQRYDDAIGGRRAPGTIARAPTTGTIARASGRPTTGTIARASGRHTTGTIARAPSRLTALPIGTAAASDHPARVSLIHRMSVEVAKSLKKQLPLPENIRDDMLQIQRDPVATLINIRNKSRFVLSPDVDDFNKFKVFFAAAHVVIEETVKDARLKEDAHAVIGKLEALERTYVQVKVVTDVVSCLLTFVVHCDQSLSPPIHGGSRRRRR